MICKTTVRQNFLAILFSLIFTAAFSQVLPYQLFDSKGKKVSYKKMIRELQEQDLVFFGELHNNAIAHWLELRLIKDLHAKSPVVVAAEMFEADQQAVIDKFLKEEITLKALDTLTRLWPNFRTDYAPVLAYARQAGLPFVASNVPRPYANAVYRGGWQALDTLSESERAWVAPLPIAFDPELPTYQNILKMMGTHGKEELVMAQALKDATMAHFILRNRRPGSITVHLNGSYHSDYKEGIGWYIRQQAPEVKFSNISTVVQQDLNKLEQEHLGKADFIIVVDQDMTNTY